MVALLAFGTVLMLAVLISELAHRSVLSTALVFLGAGVLLGQGVTGVLHVDPTDRVVSSFAELALFAVLFSDGMKAGLSDLRSTWRLPGQALLVGMPITLFLTALFARYVAGLAWAEAFLVGAALSPTDPVFAAAIVGREEIPYRLRHLLNVESGLNDGLALPVVVVLLSVVDKQGVGLASLAGEVALGVAIGIAVPWVAIRLQETRLLAAAARYEPLNALAMGLVVLGLSSVTHANEFLAAFAAGATIATRSPDIRASFHQFGELIAELLKLAAIMVFGALVSPSFLGDISVSGYVFALLALVVARPVAIAISFARSRLPSREWLAAAWFGPKGFASVVYGLLILRAAAPVGDELFHLIALVVVASIVAHSSTDVLVARWFEGDADDEAADDEAPGGGAGTTEDRDPGGRAPG